MNTVLRSYGLDPSHFDAEKIGSGHIHDTYKLIGKDRHFILQRVNKNVFREPELIARNNRLAADHLQKEYPGYLFLTVVPSVAMTDLVYDGEGFPWRLFNYLENTLTLDKINSATEAFSAAKEFGKLTRYLSGVEVSHFRETIPRFHDLDLRYRQFTAALANAPEERIKSATRSIEDCKRLSHLVDTYRLLTGNGSLLLRVTHNDTKINNILFDAASMQAVCVIDLDTLMPGYFIYDLGDMVRTFVSPVTEEEKDYSRIVFRKEIYEALLEGYLVHMNDVMSDDERAAIPFSGKMMAYIMALRFLTDFLNGDIYYNTHYPGQNLVRAGNQLAFMKVLEVSLPGA